MLDPAQILLFAVVIILTILLLIIGWQIYLILSEIRYTLRSINSIVDKTKTFSGNIGKSVNTMSGFTQGVKAIIKLVSFFKKNEKTNEQRKQEQ